MTSVSVDAHFLTLPRLPDLLQHQLTRGCPQCPDFQRDLLHEVELNHPTQRVQKQHVIYSSSKSSKMSVLRWVIYFFGQFKVCFTLQQSNSDIQMFVLAGDKKSSSSILDDGSTENKCVP